MSYLRIFFLFVFFFSVACSGAEDFPEIALTFLDESGEEIQIREGDTWSSETKRRDAELILLRGRVGSGLQPYSATLEKTIDATIYYDRDDELNTPQWITRARLLDESNQVLWEDRVNTLFQLMEYLEVIVQQLLGGAFTARQIYSFVEPRFPQLLDFPVRFPVIDEAQWLVLTIEDRNGDAYEIIRLSMEEIDDARVAPAPPNEVIDFAVTGDSSDRIEIVIIADGYRAEDREKFELDAGAISRRILASEPFTSHEHLLNIRGIFVESAEWGAGYDCTGNPQFDRNCKEELRDTAVGTVFVINALADMFGLNFGTSDRVAMPIEIARVYEAAAAVPFDEIIVLSNTRRRSGFAGLYMSVVTAYDQRQTFPDVAVHELGHSFGLLGDEYMVPGDPCLFNEPRVPLPPNIASTAEREELKWSPWVDDHTPLPTPVAERENHEVGAYLGAYNCPELYRPSFDCKMNTSENRDFCRVCSEQLIQRFYVYVDPTPNEPVTVEAATDGYKFTIPQWPSNAMRTVWFLDEEEIGEGAEFTLDSTNLSQSGTFELTAVVFEDSSRVLADDPRLRKEFRWQIQSR